MRAIADYLELGADDEMVDTVTEMLSYENVRHVIRAQRQSAKQIESHGLQWDPKTLFNERHIRDNPSTPEAVISAAQRTAIAEALPEWTNAAGRLRLEVRVHGMLTATASADFAGKANTGMAVGIIETGAQPHRVAAAPHQLAVHHEPGPGPPS